MKPSSLIDKEMNTLKTGTVRYEHGGNLRKLAEIAGCPREGILDFSANINPLGPPGWLSDLINAKISSLVHYPDPDCRSLVKALSNRYQIREGEILIGNGSTELFYLLPRVLPVSSALVPVPSYADYTRAPQQAGLPVEVIPLEEGSGFELDLSALRVRLKGNELVVIGLPNNPTGLLFDTDSLRMLAVQHPSTFFMIDEAFIDFIAGADSLISRRLANVIVLRSLTKFYAIPGLRLGWAAADSAIVERVRAIAPPWSVNSIAQAVGEALFQMDNEYAERTRSLVQEEQKFILGELRSFGGLTAFPGKANFLLVRIDHGELKAPGLARRMLKEGLAIRVCDNFPGLDDRFFRLAVRTREENRRLLGALQAALGRGYSPGR
ncbi:MAG: threonine-phosphate decarboxylase CobD [bacterium]